MRPEENGKEGSGKVSPFLSSRACPGTSYFILNIEIPALHRKSSLAGMTNRGFGFYFLIAAN